MTLEYYFEKYGINPENIVWIARDRATYKTIIHMISGREIMLQRINVTFIRTELEGKEFYFIGNSTLVRANYIERIEGRIYYMAEGSILTETQRMNTVHKARMRYLQDKKIADEMTWGIGYIDITKLPLAILAVEVKQNHKKKVCSYAIAHCTDKMAESVGTTVEEMTGRSFFEVFPNATPTWKQAFQDAAYEGKTSQFLVDDRKRGREMYVICYPMKAPTYLCIMLPFEKILGAKHVEM